MRIAGSLCMLLQFTQGCDGDPPVDDADSGDEQLVPASRRAISFASAADDGFLHEGTLQVPAHVDGEKLPAVIFAHGSGPNDRDETLAGQLGMVFGFDIPVFAEIGKALQAEGFVVLRFDKRTCGPFNGCADNGYPTPSEEEVARITVDTFIADVEGGLAFLADQPEVDPERLFVIGHSMGASYAPRLLTEHPAILAGVMLAAPFQTIDRVLLDQADKLAELLAATGASESEIDAQLADLRQQASDLEALRHGTFAGTEIAGSSIEFWDSWLDLGVAAPELAAGLDRPLLVLSGDYDWNVSPEETEMWAAHLEGSIHQARVIPCVSHALNCISNADWLSLVPSDLGTSVEPRVIDAIVEFLSSNL